MFSSNLRRVSTALASNQRRYLDAFPDVLPLLAGLVLFIHRELIAYPLNTEPDWPWQKQIQKPPLSESITTRE